jgi:actin-related protein
MTFGGDEITALVLEVGSSWTKAGYSGEDSPKVAFPSIVGSVPSDGHSDNDGGGGGGSTQHYFAESATTMFRENMQVQCPLEQGLGTYIIYCYIS